MADFNQVTLVGRLVRDPELKFLPNQTAICTGSIAVGRKFTTNGEKREETSFIDFAIFGKGGEVFNQYQQKGSQVLLSGRLRQEVWEDKNGGGKRSKLSVIVEDFQFLGGKGGSTDEQPAAGHGEENQTRQAKYPHPQRTQTKSPPEPAYSEPTFTDDEIPF